MALWSQWFPPQGPADPHEPFVRRLGSALRSGLEAWALFDMVGAVAPRYDTLSKEPYSPPGYRAVVDIIENPGQNWMDGTDEEVPLLPKVWETSLQLRNPITTAVALYGSEDDGLADFICINPVENTFTFTWLVGALFELLVRELSEVNWWAWIPSLLTLLARKWQIWQSLENLVSRLLARFKRIPRIARVQRVNVVADGAPPPSSFSEGDAEVVALIANMREHADNMEQWLKERQKCRELVSAAAVHDDFDDACFQQAILESLVDEPKEVSSSHPRNAATTDALTEDVRAEPVLRPTGDLADAESLEPPTTKTKKKNRPSQAARHRAGRRAEKERERILGNPSLVPSSASSSVPGSSTPSSALAPVFSWSSG